MYMVEMRSAALVVLFMLQASLLLIVPYPSVAHINPGANIVIEGNGGFSNPYVTGAGTTSNPYLMQDLDMGAYNIQIKNTTSKIILRNITFTQSTRHALYLYNVDNIILDNISCTDRSKFVYFYLGSNLVIRDSKVTNVRSNLNLIEVALSDIVTISGSTFLNRTGERGSWLYFDSTVMTSAVEDCTFWGVGIKNNGFTANNRIERCRINDHGISVDNTAPGARIQNCTIDYPSGNAIAISRSSRIDIKGNRILNANNGIYFTGSPISSDSDYGRIDNNTFESCSSGIGAFMQWPNQPSRYLVTDNYFGNCSGSAISWQMGTSNRMWDNIFFHNAGTGDSGSAPQAAEGWQWGGNSNLWTYGGRGNFYQNHRTPDVDGDGVVDVNYTIPSGTTTALDTAPYTNRYLDRNKPTVSILSPSGEYANNYYTIVRFSASDIGSGIIKVQRSMDGSHWTKVDNPSATSIYLKKGSNDLYLRAIDRAGLVQTVKKPLELNSSSDPLHLDFPTEGQFVRTDPMEIRWSKVFQLSIENQTIGLDGQVHYLDTDQSTYTTSLSEGSHFLRLSVLDPYGMRINRTSNITVDLTKPELDIASPQDGSVISNPLVGFRIFASDNLDLKSVMVNVDGLAWSTFDPEVNNMRILAPGEHTFSVTVTDLAGWSVSKSIEFTMTEEGTGNGLVLIDPAHDGSYTADPSHTVKWDFNGTFAWNLAYLRVGAGNPFVKIGGSRTWEVNLPLEGAYEVTVRLIDSYENYVETKGMLYRDSTPPRVFIPGFEDGERIAVGSFDLNWTTIDESPIISYDYTVDGGDPIPINASGVRLDLSEGPHTIGVRAFDAAGNAGEIVKGVIIDLTPTTVHINAPTKGSVTDGIDVAVRWDLSNTSDVSSLTMTLDDETPIDIIDKISHKVDNIVNEGTHTITIACADRAGNLWSDSVTFTVDRMDPEVGWRSAPPGYLNSTSFNLTFYANDSIGIASLVLDIDQNRTNVTGLEWSNVFLSEGSHNITLGAVDWAGRKAATDKAQVIVDLVRPSLQISEQMVTGGKASFSWAASDDRGVQQFAISVDGGPWQTGAKGVKEGVFTSEKLVAGPHTIMIKIVDLARNERVFEWAFNVTASGGIDVPKDDGSAFPWWIVPLVLAAVIVLVIIVAAMVLMRRPKESQAARGAGPRKLSIGAIPAAISPELPPNRPEGLPGAKIEEAEDGSGYIRPKTRERPTKKPRQLSQDQVEETGADASASPAPEQAPMQAPEPIPYGGGEAPMFAEAPAPIDDAPVYYRSPPTVPDVVMPSVAEPPSAPDGGLDEVLLDIDGEEEFEEISEFESIEE